MPEHRTYSLKIDGDERGWYAALWLRTAAGGYTCIANGIGPEAMDAVNNAVRRLGIAAQESGELP